MPAAGTWRVILNSDAATFGGSGLGTRGPIVTVPIAYQGQAHSAPLTLPALSALFLEHVEPPYAAPGAVELPRDQ